MKIPKFLIERYQFWKENTFKDYKDIYQQASKTPQKPIAMIITCCDSRILENTMFGGNIGDYFIHRNIANIVPSKNDKDQNIQTLSAIEYALKVLKIQNLIILGHSNCGGVEYSYKTFLDKKNIIHKIPLEEVQKNFKAIHNTKYKKMVRKQMLDGERPKECEYCWKVEDLGKTNRGSGGFGSTGTK